MRKLIILIIVINLGLIFMPVKSLCYAADTKLELDWDYMSSYNKDRDLDTISVHILEKISETKNRSVYRGITITQPRGDITFQQQTQSSSATGAGPVYMLRHEKHCSDKLSLALDISGGLILYDKAFPAGGKHYNFMWRIGPQFIYKINENSSVNVGYMFMHVSNGHKNHNPGYDSNGISLGFVTNF